MTEFTAIPVLDLSPLINGEDTADLAKSFADAYGNTGFAYVINHGVDTRYAKPFSTPRDSSMLCPTLINRRLRSIPIIVVTSQSTHPRT